ncbi:hypothetical protein CRYUN_Cryun38cG0014500 [Craigia yunnanensis]
MSSATGPESSSLNAEDLILGWFGLSRISGLMGILVIPAIVYCQIKKRKKTQKQKQDKEIETVMELQVMSRELVVYNNEKPGPKVEKALDEEVGIEEQTVERFIQNMIKEKPTRFPSQLLENFTSNYSSKLGEGGYGAVYKGHFPNGEQIAVKVLSNNGIHERVDDQFMAEVNTIGRTYHRNLIADFGIAKLYDKDNTIVTLSRGKGTPGYAAPELWMPFPVSYKCDVYSFGVMLFEIVGRRRNFNTNLNEIQEWFPLQVWESFDRGELEDVLANCEIQEENMVKAKTMATLALWCVQYSPKDRPSMMEVVKILEGEAEVPSPPNPFQHLISSAKLPSSIASSSNSTIDYDEDY